MAEIRTHEQVVGVVCTLAMEAHNDCEQGREEYGTQTRQAMRWLEKTDAALRDRLARAEEALREIAGMCANGYYQPGNLTYAAEAKRIARAALAAGEKEKKP